MESVNVLSKMIKLSIALAFLSVLASCSSTEGRNVAGSVDDYRSVEKTHNKRFIKGDNF